jgi:hypothetical protein
MSAYEDAVTLASLLKQYPNVSISNPLGQVYVAELRTSATARRVIAAYGIDELADRLEDVTGEASEPAKQVHLSVIRGERRR